MTEPRARARGRSPSPRRPRSPSRAACGPARPRHPALRHPRGRPRRRRATSPSRPPSCASCCAGTPRGPRVATRFEPELDRGGPSTSSWLSSAERHRAWGRRVARPPRRLLPVPRGDSRCACRFGATPAIRTCSPPGGGHPPWPPACCSDCGRATGDRAHRLGARLGCRPRRARDAPAGRWSWPTAPPACWRVARELWPESTAPALAVARARRGPARGLFGLRCARAARAGVDQGSSRPRRLGPTRRRRCSRWSPTSTARSRRPAWPSSPAGLDPPGPPHLAVPAEHRPSRAPPPTCCRRNAGARVAGSSAPIEVRLVGPSTATTRGGPPHGDVHARGRPARSSCAAARSPVH